MKKIPIYGIVLILIFSAIMIFSGYSLIFAVNKMHEHEKNLENSLLFVLEV